MNASAANMMYQWVYRQWEAQTTAPEDFLRDLKKIFNAALWTARGQAVCVAQRCFNDPRYSARRVSCSLG